MSKLDMRGFDQEFSDIIDYILKITYQIWEGKQVDLCRRFYSEDCPVYTLAGLSAGAEQVLNNTVSTLSSFPDRRLHADAVLCGGNDVDGYHTSHLIHTTMTNSGPSELGAATNRFAAFQVIAHCIIKDNKIIEEWLVRDNFALVTQLGFDPHDVARAQAKKPETAEFRHWRESELARLSNSNSSIAIDHDRAAFESETQTIASLFEHVWQQPSNEPIKRHYDANAILHASAGRELKGLQQIGTFYQTFSQAFGDLKVSLDYACQQSFRVYPNDTDRGAHVAARWTMAGVHSKDGHFGPPSYASVLVLGESHYHVVDGLIVQEWTVFDELAVHTQIYRARSKP